MEADDLVACVKRYIREQTPEQEIVIITNDNDYVQLIDDYTLVVNLQGCDLKNRVLCPPAEYLEQKIIMGDKSDNIPSIARKIGEKTSAKLAVDRASLESLFLRVPSSKTQYELNKLLISFESIPADLREQALKAYKDLQTSENRH
jgi:5'-3' exonuclease